MRKWSILYLAVIETQKQMLGIHSIDQMMKNIVKSTPVALSGKKLINRSARKTLIKKLRTANVERQSIIKVTGHASEQSLEDYKEGTEQEQEVQHYQPESTAAPKGQRQ